MYISFSAWICPCTKRGPKSKGLSGPNKWPAQRSGRNPSEHLLRWVGMLTLTQAPLPPCLTLLRCLKESSSVNPCSRRKPSQKSTIGYKERTNFLLLKRRKLTKHALASWQSLYTGIWTGCYHILHFHASESTTELICLATVYFFLFKHSSIIHTLQVGDSTYYHSLF